MSKPFSTFLDRASTMVQYGVPVIPLPAAQKDPPPKGFPNLATTDMDIIKGWLIPNGKPAIATENSNCACVAKPDGFWFLDIDDVHFVSDQIEKGTGHKLQEIQTLTVCSSGDKRHFYFKQNDATQALGNFDVTTADNTELFSVRGRNEYVVSPYSVHPETGLEYEIVKDADIIEAPTWLTDWLRVAKRSSRVRKQETVADNAAKIYEGGRDEFLFACACDLRDTKISQAASLAALRVVNANRCVPPMDDATLSVKIASAYTRDPRVRPETFVESGTSPTSDFDDEPDTDSSVPRLFKFAQKPSQLSDKPVEWVIDGMYPSHGISLVCGREGTTKGIHALLSVQAMLQGTSFLGRKAKKVSHVLYVDMENPEAEVRARLAKLGLLDVENLLIWGQWNDTPPPTKLDDPIYMDYAKKVGGFIFFDSLVDFSNGADENNVAEMNEVLTPARLLSRHCEGVQIQHHSDKYGKSGFRGTTAITAAVDMAFGLRPEDLEAFQAGKNQDLCFGTIKPKMVAPFHINYNICGWDGQLAYRLINDRKVAPPTTVAPKVKPPNKVESAVVLGRAFILDKLNRQQPVTVGAVTTRLEQEGCVRDTVREASTILRAQFETKVGEGKDRTVLFVREKQIETVPESGGENDLF